ncbi:MAG TPA: S41 family peptidase [Bacteroidia bacterium]|nr:S41 family peptidase [Bacteroidota bacterium]MCE7955553.1 S41 family peptidase [Bacteroidetes bacterium CHB6]OQB62087.1 MAG: putative CtpA-like serine protease [Bacteroidetes bacterium ADurb.Bin141]HNR48967.1 S41 family peptidase [Bacteroidia bacterium]MCB0849433.1 S41 family peptidase [Bacteroidota bacterium]
MFKKLGKKIRWIIVVCLISTAGLSVYSFSEDYFEISRNLDIFATMFRELNIYYVDDIKPGELMKKGMDSMLESLDPYTNYIPESEIEDYRFMTTGQYGGIGALIGQRNNEVIITDPYEGFPAQKADLRAGDVIIALDGKSIEGKKYDEISKLLKGQPKTPVKITVKREGEPNPIEKNLVREEIKISSVPYSGIVSDSIGYIRLTGFTENAGMEVKSALTTLEGKTKLKGVILDLRGNPGGLLNEAVNIVNIFVNKGSEVVSTKGKAKEWDKTYHALNNPVDTEIPVAVLVNSSSASASEIVSGSIQDFDRGIIIGQRTFGKGLVQTTRPLSYGAQLKVTTAKYYIPSGRCIQALDYSHRNEDGSVGKIPDSLITQFKTKSGRIVFDGGGVMPDYVTEIRMLSPITQSLITKYLIFDYATYYRINHPTIAPPKEFHLSDAEYNDFVKWLSGKDYDYTTKSEKLLDDFKTASEKEKYFSSAEKEYDMLKKKVAHDKVADLQKFKDEIKEVLENEIVSRYYFQNGQIEVSFNDDVEIKKAIEALNNKAVYDSILTHSMASMREKH